MERIRELEAQDQGGDEGEESDGVGLAQGALQYLDYDRAALGGPALAKALEAVTGKDVYRPEEASAARKFNAPFPSSEELLTRAGVKDGGKVPPLLALLGITPRKLAGMGLDAATSLSTYATGGIAPIMKNAPKGISVAYDALTQPLTSLLQLGARAGWTRAFKHLDAEAINKGKRVMPSEVLTDAGVAAFTRRGLHEQTGKVADAILEARNRILDEATDAGGIIDVDVATDRAHDLITKYRSLDIDQADEIADALEKEVQSFERLRPAPERTEVVRKAVPPRTVQEQVPSPILQDAGGQPIVVSEPRVIPGRPAVTRTIPERPGTSPSRASDIKTFFYRGTPSRTFQPYAETDQAREFTKALGLGLKDASEDAVGVTLGEARKEQVRELNERLGSLLSTRGKDLGEVSREEMRRLFTSGDAAAAGAAAAGDPSLLPKWWAIRKATDTITAPGPWSVLGRGLSDNAPLSWRTGRTLTRRAAASPWALMEDTNGEEE